MKQNNKKFKLSKGLKRERRFLIAGVSVLVLFTLATAVLLISTIIFFVSMFISSNIEVCLWNFVYMGCTCCGAVICLIISAKLVEPLHLYYLVQETYIECDGKNVWIATYLNYKESNRNLVATL